jgi:hypothetical protein
LAAGGALTALATQLAREAVRSLAREGSFGRKAVGRAIQSSADKWSSQQKRGQGQPDSKVKTPAQPAKPIVITMPKRVRNKVARRNRTSSPTAGLGSGVPSSPFVSLTGIVTSSNTGTGAVSGGISLSINSTTNGLAQTLGTVFGTNLTNWATMYRQFRIVKLRVTFITGCPNTVSGTYGMGIDADPLAATGNSYQSVVRHTPHAITPVFANASFVWTPTSHRDTEDKFTLCVSSRTDESEQSFGVLQTYSSNSAASGVTLGVLQIEGTFKFSDPC